MTSAELQRRLAPVAGSVPSARCLLDGFEEMVAPATLENLRLLVSELVTNAVVHAGLTEDERIGLRITVKERLIRVEVHDGGPGFEKPAFKVAAPEEISERGLYLVEVLSDRWGVESGDLFCVWFEITDDG